MPISAHAAKILDRLLDLYSKTPFAHLEERFVARFKLHESDTFVFGGEATRAFAALKAQCAFSASITKIVSDGESVYDCSLLAASILLPSEYYDIFKNDYTVELGAFPVKSLRPAPKTPTEPLIVNRLVYGALEAELGMTPAMKGECERPDARTVHISHPIDENVDVDALRRRIDAMFFRAGNYNVYVHSDHVLVRVVAVPLRY